MADNERNYEWYLSWRTAPAFYNSGGQRERKRIIRIFDKILQQNTMISFHKSILKIQTYTSEWEKHTGTHILHIRTTLFEHQLAKQSSNVCFWIQYFEEIKNTRYKNFEHMQSDASETAVETAFAVMYTLVKFLWKHLKSSKISWRE